MENLTENLLLPLWPLSPGRWYNANRTLASTGLVELLDNAFKPYSLSIQEMWEYSWHHLLLDSYLSFVAIFFLLESCDTYHRVFWKTWRNFTQCEQLGPPADWTRCLISRFSYIQLAPLLKSLPRDLFSKHKLKSLWVLASFCSLCPKRTRAVHAFPFMVYHAGSYRAQHMLVELLQGSVTLLFTEESNNRAWKRFRGSGLPHTTRISSI